MSRSWVSAVTLSCNPSQHNCKTNWTRFDTAPAKRFKLHLVRQLVLVEDTPHNTYVGKKHISVRSVCPSHLFWTGTKKVPSIPVSPGSLAHITHPTSGTKKDMACILPLRYWRRRHIRLPNSVVDTCVATCTFSRSSTVGHWPCCRKTDRAMCMHVCAFEEWGPRFRHAPPFNTNMYRTVLFTETICYSKSLHVFAGAADCTCRHVAVPLPSIIFHVCVGPTGSPQDFIILSMKWSIDKAAQCSVSLLKRRAKSRSPIPYFIFIFNCRIKTRLIISSSRLAWAARRADNCSMSTNRRRRVLAKSISTQNFLSYSSHFPTGKAPPARLKTTARHYNNLSLGYSLASFSIITCSDGIPEKWSNFCFKFSCKSKHRPATLLIHLSLTMKQVSKTINNC